MAIERPDLRARVAAQRDQRDAQSSRRVRRQVLRRDGMQCEVLDAGGAALAFPAGSVGKVVQRALDFSYAGFGLGAVNLED